MRDYIITTDAFCDMPMQYCEENSVPVLNAMYRVAGKEYITNTPEALSCHAFYDLLRGGELSKTAQVNMDQVTECFSEQAKAGKDVFHLAFSSALSGTYQACKLAADDVMEKYPDCRIVVMDSLCASMGQGLLLEYCLRIQKSGAPLDALVQIIESERLKFCHFFTVDDLDHLHRGGRVSKLTAIFGTALGIKPVLFVNDLGQLISYGKARGRKPSIAMLVDSMAKKYVPSDMPVFINHSDVPEDAEYLAGLVRERFGIQDIRIGDIGPLIGAHVGPGTLSVYFVGTDRHINE